MKKILISIIAAIFTLPAMAQLPILSDDIIPGKTSSFPQGITSYNGKLYFGATDTLYGRELWVKDSAKKSARMGDFYPGKFDGFLGPEPTPFNGKLYFGGRTTSGSSAAFDLAVFDGGSSPSIAIPSIGDASSGQATTFPVVFGSKLYFVGDSLGARRDLLFSYDGANTVVSYGNNGGPSVKSYPFLIGYGGKLYLMRNGTLGQELYALDTLTNQVSLVADICKGGSGNSNPGAFVVSGSKLYFIARDTAYGYELYSYDGSSAKRLTDIVAGKTDGIRGDLSQNMVAFKGGIFFNGKIGSRQALHRYDTATGAITVVCDPVTRGGIQAYAIGLYSTPNNIYFYWSDTVSGTEVWKYNGTSSGLVADLRPGKANGAGVSNFALHYDGYVYFTGEQDNTGKELYRILDDSKGAGVENVNWNGSAVLYPNPVATSATLSIALQSPQTLRVVLTDMQGREVWASATLLMPVGKSDVSIPMQCLAAGQYCYRISGDKGQMLVGGLVVKQ